MAESSFHPKMIDPCKWGLFLLKAQKIIQTTQWRIYEFPYNNIMQHFCKIIDM